MSATDIGLNFRSTSGFVTDGADETYVVAADSYPTTRAGWTFGYEAGPGSAFNSNSGIDRRFAGVIRSTSSHPFRVDLPATGDYEVHAALGSYSSDGSNKRTDFNFIDDATTFASTTSPSNIGFNNYKDASNVTVGPYTDWITDETPLTRTFASTIFRLVPNTSNNTHVAHLRIVQLGGGGVSVPIAMYHYMHHLQR